jgi:signal transduction histidine kinase
MLIAAGLFGAMTRIPVALGGLALIFGAIVVVVVNDPAGSFLEDVIFISTLCAVAFIAGVAINQGVLRAAELEQRALLVESQREEQARAAVSEERARIAREMHDVVAHALSVMVVQAEAAETMLDVAPERARRPIEAVQRTGREALGELRSVLSVLRHGGQAPELAPRAGLGGLDALVDQMRDAGLPVELIVEGRPRPVPAGIDLSAYRIVQEGLTNALKHAGPAHALVRVRYEDRELAVEVVDDGRTGVSRRNGGGHGLAGMRERVSLFGGTIEAGARPEGGFALRVRLPLEEAAAG